MSVTDTEPTYAERILRALTPGPTYEGALHLIVGGSRAHFYRNLRHLEATGRVTRDLPDNPQTWKLA